MASTWFVFDKSDGGLRALAKPVLDATPRDWKERTMESILGLNPELVGAGDCLPVFLHGGQSGADQTYIDELGRLTIVEVKSQPADERDLVQAIGYAYHAPVLGVHDHARAADALARRSALESGLRILAVSSPDLERQVHSALENDKPSSVVAAVERLQLPAGHKTVRELADAAARRLGTRSYRDGSLQDVGKKVWGKHAFKLIGAPPRIVLVAPSFTEGCVANARQLVERWVNLRLVSADIRMHEKSGRLLVVHEEALEGRPQMDRVWRALAEVWRDDGVSKTYRPACWYMRRPKKGRGLTASLDLSAEDAPGAEMALYVDEDQSLGGVVFRIRHSHYDGDTKKRTSLRKELERRFPSGGGLDGGDFYWEFSLPKENAKWIECAKAVAKTGAAVLRE